MAGRVRNGAFLKTLFPHAAANGTMSGELYLSLVTMHGTIMVFFVLTTAPQGGFGNYFLPIQIGAEDMAFPVVEHDVVLGHIPGPRGFDQCVLRKLLRPMIRTW